MPESWMSPCSWTMEACTVRFARHAQSLGFVLACFSLLSSLMARGFFVSISFGRLLVPRRFFLGADMYVMLFGIGSPRHSHC
ncbi:hypothetical protein BDY17DRAFT_126762 [Neohortaea acidophila]|uniref:Uncharacterized protein n=1 Tax=Neohortaea acidophila TaxID=245834 RepID=A0A6A6PXC8_9PEZI|nr:uncharacterized protein BDY17DRAFT_126762 [Neohortaea acidophila]KAF2484359.1 hypothetical protein BDY17DRAFT_126762 [Neohortaea acidophila]